MLEEACCVPLVDVQRHRQEEMHILPCVERLWTSIEGRFRLLKCGFHRSCYASGCHCHQALVCCQRSTVGCWEGSHTPCLSNEAIPRRSQIVCLMLYISLSMPTLGKFLRLYSEWCCHTKSESLGQGSCCCCCWKSPGSARSDTSLSQSCNARSRQTNTASPPQAYHTLPSCRNLSFALLPFNLTLSNTLSGTQIFSHHHGRRKEAASLLRRHHQGW